MAFQTKLIVFLLFLTLSACSTAQKTVPPNLTVMPQYEDTEANLQYAKIVEVDNLSVLLASILRGMITTLKIDVNEDTRTNLSRKVDIYLYWKSVAVIQLFYGDYKGMEKSLDKATDGLNQYRSILESLVKANQL